MSRPSHLSASQRHYTLRNPWLEGPLPRPGSRSSGSTTYDGYVPVDGQYASDAPEPPPLWQQHNLTLRTAPPVYEIPGAPHPSRTLPSMGRHSYPSTSERPLTPGHVSQTSGSPGGAGPGCDALDTWCYYFIQAVLSVAALTGISLLIAAAVLSRQPARAAASNLSALPYIGIMLATVSGALLIVQKCARNEKKMKRRRQQQQRTLTAAAGAGTLRRQVIGGSSGAPGPDRGDLIPLQEMHTKTHPPFTAVNPYRQQQQGLVQHQFQPLLGRPHQPIRSVDVPLSPSGVPWWRRQPAYPGRAVHPS